jgi:hypothetical protein
MSKSRAIYSGLSNIPTFFTDPTLTSEAIFKITEFPLRLTAGKNLFKLQGNPENLKLGSGISCEVLDSNGDAIYSELLSYIDEDKSRVFAIYIYEDTPPGPSTVTLVGEVSTLNNINIPEQWRNKINVKWSRQLPTNPTAPNESEIIFVNEPTVTISENIGVHNDRSYSTTQFPAYSTGTVQYSYLRNYPVLTINGGKFNGDMVGGTITIPTPLSLQPTPTYNVTNTTYTSKIKKVLSDTAIQLETPYVVNSNQSIFLHTYNSFTATTFTASYESTPEYVSTQNSQSFALVQIDKLEPSAGDISRIKVFANTKGTVGTWELVNDVALEGTEIFVDSTASLTPDQSIGVFTTQSVIDTYWEGHTYLGATETTAPTLTWTTASINNAMLIDSAADITSNTNVVVAQVKNQYAGYFISQSEYKVTIDALATRSTVSSNKNPKLFIYASGSAFNYTPSDLLNQALPITVGKKIAEIECTATNQRYDDIEFEFKADKTGNGSLLFVVDSGQWQIADIKTLTNAEIGYSPNYTRIRSEIPTKHKSDNQLSFKVEYYNIVGNRSKTVSYIYDKNWEGGNRYIDGGFSMLTGSLYVADSLRSGIDISGLKNTGYIRSLGYEGFNQATGSNGGGGFLLFSGSALPQQTATPYQGIGLEMVATSESYFKFRTDPSELEIVTDKFFLGKVGEQFISGSNGNIEISSSNFQLNPDGTINATGGTIGGTVITDTTLKSGTNLPAPDNAPAFQLNDNGSISGSDLYIREVFNPGSGYQQFELIDTAVGKVLARNIGRQVVSDINEYTRISANDPNSVTFTTYAEYVCQLMPYENKLLISYDQQTQQSVLFDTGTQVGRVRLQYARAVTGSYAGGSSTTIYDEWEAYSDISTTAEASTGGTNFVSKSRGPSNGLIVFSIPPVSQVTKLKIQLQLNTTGTSTSTLKGARVKNLTITATSEFAGDFATSTIPQK